MSTPSVTVAVLGAPSSGKGTLCKMLVQDASNSQMRHVSVGDLLRAMGPAGPDINAHMANGTVMRGDEIVPIIASHVSSLCAASPSDRTVILLDGFPRNADQEELARTALTSTRDSNGGLFPDLALYFSCPKELLKQRYLERRRTGQDDEALFEKRWVQHETEIPAVLHRYRERGILLEIDTSGTIDESFEKMRKTLETVKL